MHTLSRTERWAVAEARVRRYYLQRVPLLGLMILLLFPIIAATTGRSLLRNLFDLEPQDALIVTTLAVLAAWSFVVLSRIAAVYGERRNSGTGLSLVGDLKEWGSTARDSLFFATPTIVVILSESTGVKHTVATVAPVLLLLGVYSGSAADLALRGAHRLQQSRPFAAAARWLDRMPDAVSAGFIERPPGGPPRVLAGHAVAALGMIILLVAYIAAMIAYYPGWNHGFRLPVAAYGLLLLMLTTTALSAIAFFLDRFRVPTLLLGLAWAGLCLSSNGGHRFELHPVAAVSTGDASVSMPSPLDVLTHAVHGSNEPFGDTVVVVCASGGGIHASAWTSRVLRWLQEDSRLGPSFMRRIRLFSSTSGGSVGVMYYLAGVSPTGEPPSQAAIEQACVLGSRSSLSAVGWGLAYPDFARAVLPLLAPSGISRATLLEDAWSRVPPELSAQGVTWPPNWSDWIQATGRGFPGVVFNAFDVESGRRVLLNTVSLPNARSAVTFPELVIAPTSESDEETPVAIQGDMSVVTAARLSATFPYVSPISRPRLRPRSPSLLVSDVAVADGGYFDNSGILSAAEWIRSVTADPRFASLGIRRIVVVEIRAYAREAGPSARDEVGLLTRFKRPFSDTAWGPVLGMMRTRTSSQIARADSELELLTRALAHEGVELHHVSFVPGTRPWPLSWHLTPAEVDELNVRGQEAFQESVPELLSVLGIMGPSAPAPVPP